MVKRTPRLLLTIAALIPVYFIASKLGLELAVVHPSATAVWPGTGIALAALLLLGFEVWPGIFLGAFLVNLTTAGTIATSLGMAIGNTMEAVLGAYLVVRFANGRHAFERAEDVFKFAFLAGGVSTAIAASIGVASLYLGGFTGGASPAAIWLTWWLGDMAGALVLTPCLIFWSERPSWNWRGRSTLQGALAVFSLLLVGFILFGGFLPSGLQNYSLAFLCIPLIVWATFHLRPHESATAVLALSGIAIWGTLRGIGSFASKDQNESLLLLQAFMCVIAMTSLVLSAVAAQRESDEASRLQSENRLQLAQAAAQIGTWEWDPLRGTNSLSPELHEMFGTMEASPDRVKKWESRVHPEDWPKVQSEMETANRTGVMEFEYRYQHPRRGLRWFYSKGRRLLPGEVRMFGVVLDVTERKQAEEDLKQAHRELEQRVRERTAELSAAEASLRALSGRLLQMQDNERRRIARELHDSAGQLLVALKLNLGHLQRRPEQLSPNSPKLEESMGLIDQLSQELRTISHLLHPPLLDELGLISAVRWYVEGFSERSKIPVSLELSPHLGRHSNELETAVFRIIQECLTNIHRHSGSSTASVEINCDAEQIVVEVRDQGKGISPKPKESARWQVAPGPIVPGVGIQGMRERVRQLGGRLDVRSDSRGTTVLAMLPIAQGDGEMSEPQPSPGISDA